MNKLGTLDDAWLLAEDGRFAAFGRMDSLGDTAATISRMPAAPFAVKSSAKTQTPITTAVSGSMAPKIEVSVGPMLLMACTSAMFETAVAGMATPRI